MKERPILFSTPMVHAILDGRKTQTRRIVKPQPIFEDNHWKYGPKYNYSSNHSPDNDPLFASDKYSIGDLLWVRETYFYYRDNFYYRNNGDFIGDHKWKPSIFMPKEAARIWLEVTDVRVERLQDISPWNCLEEGIEFKRTAKEPIPGTDSNCKNYLTGKFNLNGYASFQSLWQSINGPDSWNQNPWVWVVEFKVLKASIHLPRLQFTSSPNHQFTR